MNLNELRDRSHSMAREKGWYDGKDAVRNIGEMLVLLHSEVSEALEDYRNGHMTQTIRADGKPEGFPSELADIAIRLGDLAGYLEIDLEQAVADKMAYNATRAYRHGNKKA